MDQSLEREIRRLFSCFHAPADPQGRAFVSLADAYRRAGDLLRARLVLEEGLRRHPDLSSAHVVAMRIARDVSDHSGALDATRRVLELDPGNVEARRVLADVGPLAPEAPNGATSASPDAGDAELPNESWMVGDAGVWGAGTDSGLASVDPEALEAEERKAAVLGVEEKRTATSAAEHKRIAARKAEARTAEGEAEARAAEGEAEARAAEREAEARAAEREAEARVAEGGAGASSAAVESAAHAGIYTRTMGRLYEEQGLQAQAIAVYERLLESEPGDEELAGRIERLRRRTRDAVRAPGDGPHVVPIEDLAPDAPDAGARGEAP